MRYDEATKNDRNACKRYTYYFLVLNTLIPPYFKRSFMTGDLTLNFIAKEMFVRIYKP